MDHSWNFEYLPMSCAAIVADLWGRNGFLEAEPAVFALGAFVRRIFVQHDLIQANHSIEPGYKFGLLGQQFGRHLESCATIYNLQFFNRTHSSFF